MHRDAGWRQKHHLGLCRRIAWRNEEAEPERAGGHGDNCGLGDLKMTRWLTAAAHDPGLRALHFLKLNELVVQMVKPPRRWATMAIDGTKIKANARRHKAMSYERKQEAQAELKAQIDALLERAKTTDATAANDSTWIYRPRSSDARTGWRHRRST